MARVNREKFSNENSREHQKFYMKLYHKEKILTNNHCKILTDLLSHIRN